MQRIICAWLFVAWASSDLTVRGSEYVFEPPSDDRWHYPFNFTVGVRTTASCFGTGLAGFNNRDGIAMIAWDTSESVEPGLGADLYNIVRLSVRVTNIAGAAWPIDLTIDEWFTYDVNGDELINSDGIGRGEPGDVDGESDDPDPGRVIELFGAGFGPQFTEPTWNENSVYVGSDSVTMRPRDPFPFVFQDETFEILHVEDAVRGLHNEDFDVFSFTAIPWAIGQPVDYVPGKQNTPFDIQFEVDLSHSDGRVRRYFQEQLDRGRVIVALTSLNEAFQEGPQQGYPTILTRDSIGEIPGARAPSLTLVLSVDCNDNGVPDDQDIEVCLADLGCADCNGNGIPDLCDLNEGVLADDNDNGVPDSCECVSHIDCKDGDPCTFGLCQEATCTYSANLYGDVNHDDIVDINDIFCVLDGFQNEFVQCTIDDVDLQEPCTGDGTIDILDIFAVLDAFRGVDPCCHGTGSGKGGNE